MQHPALYASVRDRHIELLLFAVSRTFSLHLMPSVQTVKIAAGHGKIAKNSFQIFIQTPTSEHR